MKPRLLLTLSAVSLVMAASPVICSAQLPKTPSNDNEYWKSQLERFVDAKLKPLSMKKLWEIESDGRVFKPKHFSFSRDGSRLLVLDDYSARLFDASTGREVAQMQEPIKAKIKCGALSNKGDRAVIGLEEGGALEFTEAAGATVAKHQGAQGAVSFVAISQDGKWVTIVDVKGFVHRYPSGEGEGISFQVPGGEGRSQQTPWSISPSGTKALCNTHGGILTLVQFEEKNAIPFFSPMFGDYLAISDRWGACISAGGIYNQISVPPKNSSTQPLRFGILDDAVIDSDENLRLLSRRGIEIRKLQSPQFSLVFWFEGTPYQGMAQAKLCPSLWRIAAIKNGALTMWDLGVPSDCAAWRFSDTIKRLLKDKDFDKLEALAAALQNDLEPFAWNPDSTKYRTFEDVILGYPSTFEADFQNQVLKPWLQQRPDSTVVRLLEARDLVVQGWRHRGGGFADTVTPEGGKKFRDLVQKAREILEPMLRRPNIPPEAYSTLFEIAKAQGWEGTELRPYQDLFLERYPRHLTPHLPLVEKLMPRWGGGRRSAVEYADDVARRVEGNAGEMLYARMALRLYPYYEHDEFWEATGFDYDRIQAAFKKRLESHPQDGLAASAGFSLTVVKHDAVRQAPFREHIVKNRTPMVSNPIHSAAQLDQLLPQPTSVAIASTTPDPPRMKFKPSTAPPPPAAAKVIRRRENVKTGNFLEHYKAEACTNRGEATTRDKHWLVGTKADTTRIEFPDSLPETYLLEMKVRKEDGSEALIVGLPVGDRHAVVMLNAYTVVGGFGGLELSERLHEAKTNVVRQNVLKIGTDYVLKCFVDRNRIQVELDGEKIADWEGDPEQLPQSTKSSIYPGRLTFGVSSGVQYRLLSVRVDSLPPEVAAKPYSGPVTPKPAPAASPPPPVAAKVAPSPAKASKQRASKVQTGEYLEHYTAADCAKLGEVTTSGKHWLIGKQSTPSKVEFPDSLPETYVLELKVRKEEGADALIVGFPVGDRHAVAMLNAYGDKGGFGGLELDQPLFQAKSNVIAENMLKVGTDHVLKCIVEKTRIQIELDGKQIANWEGDPQKLPRSSWPSSVPGQLNVTTWATKYRLLSIRVEPLPEKP